jgi:elongation factor Ts
MTISAEMIKRVREKTAAGLMDVRNALVEAEGDEARAMEILRQKGAATAEKKSDRATGEGQIQAVVLNDGAVGALVEVNCETDFSAKNDRFITLVNAIAQAAAEKECANAEAVLEAPYQEVTLKTLLTDTVGAVKENMTLTRFVRYDLQGKPGLVHAYIHGGRIGVLIEASLQTAANASKPEFRQLVKDLAMQIAASAPEFVNRSDIPDNIIAEEKRVELGKEDILSKPEAMREKIVVGRIEKNLAQRVLLLQPFVKDPSVIVEALIAETSKKVDDTISIVRFSRYVLGETSSAQPENADEVAACSV